ncbi:MAG: alpha-galactosidase, partial [Anaerolineae bacterium]|nr:alpha-galactosidase [Anaerolineae bacterium]
DLRAFIDGQHARGKHVLLWFAPFFCESGSRLAQEHPDWMIHNRDGSPSSHTWMKKTIYTPDFTHPDVRGYFTRLIGKLLGSGPGQWNADGFKIDGYSFLPDVDNVYHDPEWGTGDRFQYRADKLIYDAAKSTKADALVEQSFANPLFNDTQDVCRLDDASSYDTDLYENRAWVALLAGAAVPDTDDWSAFKKMFVHSTLRKSVYGIPTLYAVKYRGAGRMGGASGGYPVPIAEEDYSRVSAILRVYQHAPINATQERHVDPDNKVFWRKYTQGPLAGFYAATTLAGNTALATYQPGLIQLAAIVETQAAVPLPPGCKVKSVKEILSSGPAQTPRYCLCDDTILLWMQPSTGAVDHYEIELVPDS